MRLPQQVRHLLAIVGESNQQWTSQSRRGIAHGKQPIVEAFAHPHAVATTVETDEWDEDHIELPQRGTLVGLRFMDAIAAAAQRGGRCEQRHAVVAVARDAWQVETAAESPRSGEQWPAVDLFGHRQVQAYSPARTQPATCEYPPQQRDRGLAPLALRNGAASRAQNPAKLAGGGRGR